MSMISAQIDELRNAAEFYDGFKAADLMRDAANTIWQLRDDLQWATVENAKLRNLVRDLYEMAYPECPSAFEAAFADRMRELGVEVNQ